MWIEQSIKATEVVGYVGSSGMIVAGGLAVFTAFLTGNFGWHTFILLNTLQLARTTTLITPNMNYYL